MRVLLCLSFMLVTSGLTKATAPEKTLNKAFKYIYKNQEEADLSTLVIPSSIPGYSVNDTVFRIDNKTGDLEGYMVVSSAMGRFDLFDFMLVYDVLLEIQDLRILVYRSDHGSEIASRGWLKQFFNYPSNTMFVYGQNIDALSGATFSAKSLTTEINRITRLLSTVVE